MKDIDAAGNRLTVQMKDGTERSYDPRRQQGVSVHRAEERNSSGDRVQLAAPSHELKVANRELGMAGSARTDGCHSGWTVAARSNSIRTKHPHLDHGYAVTSHSSQGQTADRVLIHVDTSWGPKIRSTIA